MAYRTPLARVRGLGSAKEGAEHFWRQRLTAVANIFLISFRASSRSIRRRYFFLMFTMYYIRCSWL